MYSTLRIRNFRGFKDLELRNLERITLLAGKNNTGKSAVLEALFLLCCGPLAGQASLTVLRAFRGEPLYPLDPSAESTPWDALFYNFDRDREVAISGRRDGEDVEVRLSREKNQKSVALSSSPTTGESYLRRLQVHVRRGTGDNDYIQNFEYQFSPVASGGNLSNIQQQNLSVKLETDPPAEPLDLAFFMGSRLRANQQELATRYSRLRRRGSEKGLIEAIRLVDHRIQRLEVLAEQGQPSLHFELSSSGTSYPMTVLGEGVSSVVDFITSIYLAKNGVVLIDEVENGIHHSVLEDLWTQLFRAAERADVQVVATTHSRECVEAAQSALIKRSRDLRLIRLRWPKGRDDVEPVEYDAEALAGAIDSGLEIR